MLALFSVRVLAHQVLNVERHLPSFIGCRFLKGRHTALLDPVGNHPINFAVRYTLHLLVGEVSRLDRHSLSNISLRLAIFSMAGGAVLIKQGSARRDVLLIRSQRVLQPLRARRGVAVAVLVVRQGAKVNDPYCSQKASEKNRVMAQMTNTVLSACRGMGERDSKRAGGAGGGPAAAGRGAPSATDSPAGGDSDPVALRTPTVDAPTRSPVDVPSVEAPAGVPSVQEAADSVQQTTDGVTGALPGVDETVDQVTKPLPPADEVVPEVTDPLEDAVGDATGVLGPDRAAKISLLRGVAQPGSAHRSGR